MKKSIDWEKSLGKGGVGATAGNIIYSFKQYILIERGRGGE